MGTMNIKINFINNPNNLSFECDNYDVRENCLVLFNAKSNNGSCKYEYNFISYPLHTIESFSCPKNVVENKKFNAFEGGR